MTVGHLKRLAAGEWRRFWRRLMFATSCDRPARGGHRKVSDASWKLEAGNWKLETGSWKLEAGVQLVSVASVSFAGAMRSSTNVFHSWQCGHCQSSSVLRYRQRTQMCGST